MNPDKRSVSFLFLQKKDGKRDKYAPVSYPDLSKDLWTYFEKILGDKVYTPVIDAYLQRLRSAPKPPSPDLRRRETPSFLRIVASSDVTVDQRLGKELDSTATLKWAAVKDYIGSMADAITAKQKSVHR